MPPGARGVCGQRATERLRIPQLELHNPQSVQRAQPIFRRPPRLGQTGLASYRLVRVRIEARNAVEGWLRGAAVRPITDASVFGMLFGEGTLAPDRAVRRRCPHAVPVFARAADEVVEVGRYTPNAELPLAPGSASSRSASGSPLGQQADSAGHSKPKAIGSRLCRGREERTTTHTRPAHSLRGSSARRDQTPPCLPRGGWWPRRAPRSWDRPGRTTDPSLRGRPAGSS